MVCKDRKDQRYFLGNPVFFRELASDMPEGFAGELRRAEKDIFVAAGRSLFRRGDPAKKIFVLKAGHARLVIDTGPGSGISREAITGEIFGLPEAIIFERFETSVEAVTDCVFTAIKTGDFKRLLHLDPGLCFKLLSLLGENLHSGRQLLGSLGI
jgi:CRP-like cAMP-binding protein